MCVVRFLCVLLMITLLGFVDPNPSVIHAQSGGMTLAKAKSVVSAVVDAGYEARLVPQRDSAGTIVGWKVYASSIDLDVPIDTVKTLQDAQLVTAKVRQVVFE